MPLIKSLKHFLGMLSVIFFQLINATFKLKKIIIHQYSAALSYFKLGLLIRCEHYLLFLWF